MVLVACETKFDLIRTVVVVVVVACETKFDLIRIVVQTDGL